MTPTPGRIVLYALSQGDVDQIAAADPGGNVVGNVARVGDVLPAVIVRAWSDALVNLQVFLDGPRTHWATSRHLGSDADPGTWQWPTRA